MRQDNIIAMYRWQEVDRQRQYSRVWRQARLSPERSAWAQGGLHATGAGSLRGVHHQGDAAVLREDLQHVTGENRGAE